jgi:hypothetical protein
MSSGKPTLNRLADVAETDAIRRLLSGVLRSERKSAPDPKPEHDDVRAPAVAFVASNVGEVVAPSVSPPRDLDVCDRPSEPAPSPIPQQFATAAPSAPLTLPKSVAESMPMPIGALSFGELLERINWRNRPEDLQSLPLMGELDPLGYADTVEGVLSAIDWDDE